MNWLDFTIVGLYIVFFLGMGYFFKNNKDSKDYFLGGRSMGWFPLSLSTMATQLSAISFISAPAFVGLKMGGGMKWLTFEFAVPLAMIAIMLLVIPPLFRSGVVSIYEYVERRFSASTRMILSIVFQISRALGTGVMVYTIALILQAILDIDQLYIVLIISIITIVYSWQGGMKAVVSGDAIQMILLFGGLLICLFYGWHLVGETGGLANGFPPERLQVIDFNLGIGPDQEYGFWPMIIGGFFLYVSYYGCDQTQAQRLLSAKNEKTIRQLLLANGLLRFPVVLVYCTMGLVIGALVSSSPDFMEQIVLTTQKYFPAEAADGGIKADLMIPIFIVNYLPHGLIGLLMVAILSAAMSSLSSGVNSLSAASVEDFFNRNKQLNTEQYMRYSKYATLFWGAVCIILAFFTGDIAKTVIEAINKVGSVFYGPILATFIAAIGVKSINSKGINIGIMAGVGINVYLWLFVPEVFWFWWNAIGGIITLVVAYLASLVVKANDKDTSTSFDFQWEMDWQKTGLLVAFFVGIVLFSINVEHLF